MSVLVKIVLRLAKVKFRIWMMIIFLTNGLVLRTAPEGVGDWARGRERDR